MFDFSQSNIGHGVMLTKQEDINSKTLVKFVSRVKEAYFTIAMTSLKNDTKKLRSVPEGHL